MQCLQTLISEADQSYHDILHPISSRSGGMADAADLKSADGFLLYGFESRLRHHLFQRWRFGVRRLSLSHLPPDLYKCGGKPFAVIDNALRRKPAMLFRSICRLPFQLSQFINSESGLDPFGEAAKFLAQPLGFGGVVVLDGVLQKRVQPLYLLNRIVSPPSTTGFI